MIVGLITRVIPYTPPLVLPSLPSLKMESVDRETTRLWRVCKTVHQLVHDRGYVVSQAELEMSLQEFINTFAPTGSVLE